LAKRNPPYRGISEKDEMTTKGFDFDPASIVDG
jgi:hypothetical protein